MQVPKKKQQQKQGIQDIPRSDDLPISLIWLVYTLLKSRWWTFPPAISPGRWALVVSFGAVLRSFPEASRSFGSWSSWTWAMRLLGNLQETGLRANDAGCSGTGSPKQEMVASWWFGTMEFYDFPYIGNSNPNWFSYFSEGLKPPTRICWKEFLKYSWHEYMTIDLGEES